MLPLALLVPLAHGQDAGPIGGLAAGFYKNADGNPLVGGWVLTGRLGVRVVQPFDLEIEAGRVEGETADLRIVYFALNPRLNAVFHFTPNRRADLFLLAGAGMQYVSVERESEADQPDAKDRALYVNPSTDFVANAGPGLLLHLAGPVHIRTDLRWYGTFGPDSTREAPDTFQNLEWTIGLDFRKEEPPDLDGDGIKNKYDDCPEDPEDFDGFEDDDGCPERDNDKDGVVDEQDDCDDDPEDRDGWEDGDGCPDPDNDGDGIKDRKDECPEEPEDDDGYQDTDGCPDRDNDDDGFPDRKDKCPDDAEIFNGIDDRDGCPDEVPEEVKQFTGIIRGITFETNKAVIRPTSEFTLDAALRVFEQYPDLRIEVQGHTDDVGREEINLDLSQRRADAVVAWFVTHGIDPARMRGVGYGETLPIADNATDAGRAENRRVEFQIIREE